MAEIEIVKKIGRVTLAEGFVLPRRIRVKVEGRPDDEHLPFKGEAVLEFQGGRMEVKSLSLRQVDGGPPVTGETLRAIPRALVGMVVKMTMSPDFFGPGSPPALRLIGQDPRKAAAEGPTDNTLMIVAALYRRAYVVGVHPARAVTEVLGKPRSTVGRWIMQARERGYLGPTEERKPGEQEGD